MFDEAVLREISLSDGSSKLIFKHVYIYIYFYTSFSSRPILFHILRLELTIFSERISSFRGEIIKIVLSRYYP